MKEKGRGRTRNLVRQRDNFTCQECGLVRTPRQAKEQRKRLFDVHHLNGLCGKKSKGYDKVSEIDGLITLCHKCHYNRHDWRNGIPPKYIYHTKERNREIYEKYMAGKNGRLLAKEYKISHQRIYKIIEKSRTAITNTLAHKI